MTIVIRFGIRGLDRTVNYWIWMAENVLLIRSRKVWKGFVFKDFEVMQQMGEGVGKSGSVI